MRGFLFLSLHDMTNCRSFFHTGDTMRLPRLLACLIGALVLPHTIYGEALTEKTVITTTYQRYPEIIALRERLKTFQALVKAEYAEFHKLAYGARAYNGITRKHDSDTWSTENRPTVEIFANQAFGGGKNVELFGGADYIYGPQTDRAPRGSLGIRAQTPLNGSEDKRSEAIRILDRGSDVLIAEIAYFESVRERLKKSMQAFFLARINRNTMEVLCRVETELHMLQRIAEDRHDTDAMHKIEAAIASVQGKKREVSTNLGAEFANVKQRMGLHPNELVEIEGGPITVHLESADEMTAYALEHDPQIKSFAVSKKALEEQRAILAGASIDVLGFAEGRMAQKPYPDSQEYAALLGVVISVPDTDLKQQRLAVVDARLRELQVRIDGWSDDITLSIAQQHSRATALGQSIIDIEARLPMRERVYRNRVVRYQSRDHIIFDEVYTALTDWQNDMFLREQNAQQYALFLGELWEYSGYYFRVLKEEHIVSETE